jgi:hypothetical protein
MLERARAYIAAKDAHEDPQQVFSLYVEVCFRALLRRLRRLYPTSLASSEGRAQPEKAGEPSTCSTLDRPHDLLSEMFD